MKATAEDWLFRILFFVVIAVLLVFTIWCTNMTGDELGRQGL